MNRPVPFGYHKLLATWIVVLILQALMAVIFQVPTDLPAFFLGVGLTVQVVAMWKAAEMYLRLPRIGTGQRGAVHISRMRPGESVEVRFHGMR